MTAGAAAAGNFDELIGPLLDPGYRLAVTMLRDQGLAEDALQEAAIKAWRRVGTVRDPEALKAWFFTIVANQCRSMRRARWWSVLPLLPVHSAAQSSSEGEVIEGIDVTRALDRLSSDDRAALLLHFHYDLTYAEVGRCLGISMTAARSRIHRAAQRVRPDLEVSDL